LTTSSGTPPRAGDLVLPWAPVRKSREKPAGLRDLAPYFAFLEELGTSSTPPRRTGFYPRPFTIDVSVFLPSGPGDDSPGSLPGDVAAGDEAIKKTVLEHFPAVQAVYLFGSCAGGNDWPGSDIDLALLLPVDQPVPAGGLWGCPCHAALEALLHRPVDLVVARQVSTVFRKEILRGRVLMAPDEPARQEFEMLTLSAYQKLEQERAGILAAFQETGRAYRL